MPSLIFEDWIILEKKSFWTTTWTEKKQAIPDGKIKTEK